MVDVLLSWLHHKTSFSWRKITHTQAVDAQNSMFFCTLLRLLHFGGFVCLCVPKKHPFFKDGGLHLWPAICRVDCWSDKKNRTYFYILLVLQESWIHPKKTDMIEKHEGKHFSWYFLTIYLQVHQLLDSICCFDITIPVSKCCQHKKEETSTSINVVLGWV